MGGGNSQIDRPYSIPLQGTKQSGFSAIYRNGDYPDKLYGTPDDRLKSMKDVYIESCTKKFPNNNYIGQIKIKGPGKDGIEERELIKFTYQQAYEMAQNLGSSIVGGNFDYQEKLLGMKLIGVYSKNRYEWIIADIACVLYGLTIVPLYDTLGIQNLTHCLENSQISSLFVTQETVQTLIKLKGHGSLKNLISFDPLSPELEKKLKDHNFNLYYFSDLINKHKNFVDHSKINVPAENCLTFSYTSGTTGPPKGAMLSHRNFLAFLAAFQKHEIHGFKQNDVYLSFLPLPHVFQRVIQAGIAYTGAYSVFFNGDITKLKDDAGFLKPTIFIGVPRVFNRIVEGVQKKFSETTGISKCLVENGVKSKNENLQSNGSYTSGFYDKVVFSKTKDGFGGNVRLMITGSAPIKADVFKFMKVIMCCPFYEGYGQTENTAAAFITKTVDSQSGHVGGVVSSLQFKLSDIPEMHYTSNDKDEQGRSTPKGQIWLRGPGVFMGYYKDKEKTQQALTSDGWLKTGDVGMLIPGSNALKVIDRKKNIFKLQQGEYIASEKVEAVYSKSHLISEVFLHGETTQNFCVVVVSAHKQQIEKLAKNQGINKSYQQACQDKKIRTLVLKELNSFGKKEGLNSLENAKNIYIESDNFQNKGILTNTLKLQRFAAKKMYANQIEAMYKEGMLDLK